MTIDTPGTRVLKCSTVATNQYPGTKGNIAVGVKGNNGYFTKIDITRLDSATETDDGFSIAGTDDGGKGANYGGNIYATNKSDSYYVERLGKKSGRITCHVGYYNSGTYMATGAQASFLANVTGVAFLFSRDRRDGDTSDNSNTEGRLRTVTGVYAQGSSSSNGKVKKFVFNTTLSGSQSLNKSGIASGNHLYALKLSDTDANFVRDNACLFQGLIIEIQLNHNLSKEQKPTGRIWNLRPIITTSNSGYNKQNDNEYSSGELLALYPFENSTWRDCNPYYNNETHPKLNITPNL